MSFNCNKAYKQACFSRVVSLATLKVLNAESYELLLPENCLKNLPVQRQMQQNFSPFLCVKIVTLHSLFYLTWNDKVPNGMFYYF